MSNQVLGTKWRIEVQTQTTPSVVWKKFEHEVSTDIERTSEKIEVSSKDTGKHRAFLKTLIDTKIKCSAQSVNTPSSGFLSYSDVYEMSGKTYADANKGIYKFRLSSPEIGSKTLEFDGFFEGLSAPFKNNELIEYSFDIQVITMPVETTVA